MTVLVAAPPVPKQKYNLLDTITPQALPAHAGIEGVEYDSPACIGAHSVVGTGGTPLVCTPTISKTFTDGRGVVTGTPILIYDAISCRLLGSEDPEAYVSEALDLGASLALEAEISAQLGAAATNITPAAVPGVIAGIALLEDYIAQHYGGSGVLHLSRAAATLAGSQGGVIRTDDDTDGHLETRLGTVVIAGGGYGTNGPAAPAAGNQWIIATGQVHLYEGATITTPIVMDTPYTNQFKTLAERLYVPTWECFVAAIQVKVEA